MESHKTILHRSCQSRCRQTTATTAVRHGKLCVPLAERLVRHKPCPRKQSHYNIMKLPYLVWAIAESPILVGEGVKV